MAVMIQAMAPAVLVDLVNEWGTVPRAVAGEQDHPFPPAGGLPLGIPDELARDLDDDTLQDVADRLYPAFATGVPHECARQVTRVLVSAGVSPRVTVVDDDVVAGWSTDAPERALAGAAALAIRDHLGRNGFGRLGTCTARNCADVYIDASPTRDRRYCSVTCQNRARAAAFRSRRARTESP
ncbi:CGNR zinc finger domain-containing protein [Actinomadura mexicana]|uniref:CGNR zinc finger domain-containing protein n=1 Tax=Actinomadura mexicana TaxID=134959 RepID=A0A238UZQ3_9ACTN|nr:CGNR zinc finger domain-containing protein [Actinomadura mexicana]SNR27782.1 CGNR zinc finger domain-containing protein [Actinomadura mexicana]